MIHWTFTYASLASSSSSSVEDVVKWEGRLSNVADEPV